MTKAFTAIVLTACVVVWQDHFPIQSSMPTIQEIVLWSCEDGSVALEKRVVVETANGESYALPPGWITLWNRGYGRPFLPPSEGL